MLFYLGHPSRLAETGSHLSMTRSLTSFVILGCALARASKDDQIAKSHNDITVDPARQCCPLN